MGVFFGIFSFYTDAFVLGFFQFLYDCNWSSLHLSIHWIFAPLLQTVKELEKAIVSSPLGLNPQVDGQRLIANIPP